MKYSNKEKLSIVARCQQGESIATLSNELAIPRSTLYRWLKSFPTDSAGKPLKFSYQEYTLLQRKVEKLLNRNLLDGVSPENQVKSKGAEVVRSS